MRDCGVTRNYWGLKLACWLSHGSYWQDTLTQRQALNLIERTLNHPEVDSRWPKLQEITIEFPEKGMTASATRGRCGKNEMVLPRGTLSPLIILHEMAHLLPTIKREADHGAGFSAIHLMLVELMAPKSLAALVAGYHATHTKYDASQIPQPISASDYIPIVNGAPAQLALSQLRSLLASGTLMASERKHYETVLRQLNKKDVAPEISLHSLPTDVRIKTASLLKCNTPEDIAQLVLGELKKELQPARMRRPSNAIKN